MHIGNIAGTSGAVGTGRGLSALCVCASVALAALASDAAAEDIALTGVYSFTSIGTAFQIEEGHTYWVGQFTGSYRDAAETTIFNGMTMVCPGWLDVGTGAGGYCVGRDTKGDQVFGHFTCSNAPPPEGALLGADCSWTYTGGTGKFAGITGGGPYMAATVTVNPDGVGVGYAVWNTVARLPD